MINELLQGMLMDILSLLGTHKNFFTMSAQEKEDVLTSVAFPNSLLQLFLTLTEEDCIEEIRNVYQFLQGGTARGLLLQSFAKFLSQDLGHLLDTREPVSYSPAFSQALDNLLVNTSYQEMMMEVHGFFERFDMHVPYVMVQSPFRLSLDMRDAIRAHFAQLHSCSFPLFSVNKNLIGGIRVFIDGQTQDHSWIARLNALGNVLYSRV